MKKNYFIPAATAVVALALFSFIGDTNSVMKSDGGPPYNTNAPLDKTCSGPEGTNPCHSGGIPDNSGLGTPNIIFSGGTVYVPGQTYTITPTITHPSRNRFGFQVVSLDDNTNMFTGALSLLDTAKTRQQQPTWGAGQDRIYVMHRLAGTYPTTPNLGNWSYQWTAPATNVGNISFYACFLAANNNNTNDAGDETYWKKITISPSAVGVSELQNDLHLSVYPNPCSEYLYLTYYLNESVSLMCELIDMQGKTVRNLIDKKNVSGLYQEKVMLDDLAKGIYFVKSRVGEKERIQKVVVR